ncbi:universal stress protein [Orrella sp. 11846]|uniref:universal stress protein n=1 Tax=Orrella sp. 11846 TaxID=3409913 RepID=UPI003B5BF5B5
MSKILACVDTSPYADSVCELAAWAAKKLFSTVEILHVIQRKSAVQERRDLTGAIGLGVKSELLEELTRLEESQGKLAIEAGRAILDTAANQLRAAGVSDVTTTHRHGDIVETVLEREKDCDLLIMGNRGASADFAIAHLGSKIERVVRASQKPIFIAPRDVSDIKKVVLAYDGSPCANRALDLFTSSPLFEDLELHAVFAGADNKKNREVLDKIRERIEGAGRLLSTGLLSGSPETVIADYLDKHQNSALVMGAYGHTPLRNLIVGSTTTSLIRTVSRPILLVR